MKSENACKTTFSIEIFYKVFVSRICKKSDNNKKADNPIKMDKRLEQTLYKR